MHTTTMYMYVVVSSIALAFVGIIHWNGIYDTYTWNGILVCARCTSAAVGNMRSGLRLNTGWGR